MTNDPSKQLLGYARLLLGAGFSARAFAEELGVSERTMRRWLAGETEPPVGVLDDARTLMRERATEMRKATQ